MEIRASGSTTVEKKKNVDDDDLTQAMNNAIRAAAELIKSNTGHDVENTTKKPFEVAISQLPTEKERTNRDKEIEKKVYEVLLEIVRAAIKRAVEKTTDENELNQLEQRQQLLKRILKVFIIDFLYLKHKDDRPFWKKLLGGWFWSSE